MSSSIEKQYEKGTKSMETVRSGPEPEDRKKSVIVETSEVQV